MSLPLLLGGAGRGRLPALLAACCSALPARPVQHVYYQVPFVLALTAWERGAGSPVLALLATLGFFLVFRTVSGREASRPVRLLPGDRPAAHVRGRTRRGYRADS